MKKFLVIVMVCLLIACLCGCNMEGYDWVDTNYHFNRAILRMPDGSTKEIRLAKWADAEDGEQLTLTAEDGTRYLVHSGNCILIEDNKVG